MIGRLEGVLIEKTPEAVVLDVHGVGYELRVPLSTFFELPDEGKTVRLRVHTHVREDAFLLFGFGTELERGLFRLLLGASGVGPKLALAILSGLSAERLIAALRAGDLAALVGIPGVGKKTAERMVVELRDRVGARVAQVQERALGLRPDIVLRGSQRRGAGLDAGHAVAQLDHHALGGLLADAGNPYELLDGA